MNLFSRIGCRWIFREDVFLRILVSSIFSLFVLQLVVYESRNSSQIFRYFQYRYLDITDLFLDWISRRISKGADIVKRFNYFLIPSPNKDNLIYLWSSEWENKIKNNKFQVAASCSVSYSNKIFYSYTI